MTLRRIHIKNIVHDVALSRFDTLIFQEVLQVKRTSCQSIASFYCIVRLHYKFRITRDLNPSRTLRRCYKDDRIFHKLYDPLMWSLDRFLVTTLSYQSCSRLHRFAVFHRWFATIQLNSLNRTRLGGDLYYVMIILFPNFYYTIKWRYISLTFWCTGFKKLFHTRKTTCDCTRTSHTRAVLGIKC